ncbi:cytochrome P450 [Peniophora sp. CONT]|nr:cytochrome P450 [Peniophora sp. CONT]
MNLVSRVIESSYFDLLRRPALSLAIALNVLAFGLFKYLNSPWRKLPPGPVGYPIIGSTHRFFDSSWLLEECPKFGEVVYLNVAGQPAILLNTQKAATALLDRRSTNYSGRPRMIVANELMCDGKFLILEPFNDRLRRKRRAIHEGFNKSASMSFHGTLAEDAVRLAVSLEHDPKAFRKYYYTFSCSVVLAVTYDLPLLGRPEDDTLLSRIEAFAARAKETTAPGAHYVELLPWMKHLPEWMAKWKRDALITHRETTSFFLELMEDVETRMKQGLARSCLMSTMIQEQDRSQLSRDEIA